MKQRGENHLFDFDADRRLVVLGLNVPRELRFSPVHRYRFRLMLRIVFIFETSKKYSNPLVIAGAEAELKQPVERVIGEVHQGATGCHHDSRLLDPPNLKNLKEKLKKQPPQNSCNF